MAAIYVAAPWVRRETAREVAAQLVAMGHTITHPWWDFEAGDEDHTRLGELANLDFEAVVNADIFLLLHLEKSEGKAVESGVALVSRAMDERFYVETPMRLVGVGPRGANIFQWLPVWEWFDTLDDALKGIA